MKAMKDRDRKIAEELKRRLSEVVTLLDFRVFGSRARGEADEYSDMDIFLEVERLDDATRKLIRDVTWEIGFHNLLVISPLIMTRDEVENSPHRASPILQSVREEGVCV